MRLSRARNWSGIALAVALFFVCLFVSLALGSVSISLKQVLHLLFSGPHQGDNNSTIFWDIRMPRVLTAFLVGASLSVAGVILQNLFLNPLTDPYVTGVSSGAALGATVGIVLHLASVPWITVFAMVGGFLILAAVWGAAQRRGKIDVFVLLLIGVTVSYLATAVISVLMIRNGNDMHAILYWLMGSFSTSDWTDVEIALCAVPLLTVPMFFAKEMNILMQGEKRALELGVDVERAKRILLVTAGGLTAIAVSVSGIVGFIGLVVPHIVRLLVGPNHQKLLPVSLLVGAATMGIADLLSRTMLSPSEIPVGVVTTFVGAPLFVYLLRQRRAA